MTTAGPLDTPGHAGAKDRPVGPRAIEGLRADMAPLHAAHVVLSARLHDLARRAATAGEEIQKPERVRQVRVAARRAIIALMVFAPVLEGREGRRLRCRINRVRRAAGPVRDADVFLGFLSGAGARSEAAGHPGAEIAAESLREDRDHRAEQLVQAIDGEMPGIEKLARRMLSSIKLPDAGVGADDDGREPRPRGTLADAVREHFLALVRDACTQAEAHPSETETLHELRLACKRTRYALEIAGPCLPGAVRDGAYSALVGLQDRLGPVADLAEFVRRLRRLAKRAGADFDGGAGEPGPRADALADLHNRFRVALDSRVAEATAFVRGTGAASLTRIEADADRALVPSAQSRERRRAHDTTISTIEFIRGGVLPAARHDGPHRMAVIDVGTNSVRIEIVEAFPDRTYRVLDDEKETTRLGSGIFRSGLLARDAMERTAAAVARMASIASGYGVKAAWVRAVGTFAVRAAGNGDEFLAMVRERSGIEVAVLSPEQEGKLAFLSAERTLDLSSGTAAVVDIGGGSTEIVLSAAGVPERIYGLELGAMLLTEEFGGPVASVQEHYGAMRRRIDEALRHRVGRPLLRPQTVVGTGGTFGVLASALAASRGGDGPRLWDRHAGFEATRSDIAHLLERLRRLSPGERAEVPGIPADRADIIVAGFTLVERVLKCLGANSVRVHDRGIRDGMIHAMVAEAFPTGFPEPGPMGAVRRLAQKCNYEEAHSEHVTALALSIHDSLVSTLAGAATNGDVPLWARPESRRILEAAAVLHDIGYLVSYSAHHKHSYHLIVHGDLAGPGLFTAREVSLIALVARYHRKASPKRSHDGFGGLPKEDRNLVRRLSGILRIADGLDRTHTQSVLGVTVSDSWEANGRAAPDAPSPLVFTIEPALAGADLDTNRWGAEDKRSLFEKAFGREVVLKAAT